MMTLVSLEALIQVACLLMKLQPTVFRMKNICEKPMVSTLLLVRWAIMLLQIMYSGSFDSRDVNDTGLKFSGLSDTVSSYNP